MTSDYRAVTGSYLSLQQVIPGMPEDIDPDRMEEIENSGDTWVVDFWASWCKPCEKFSPIFEEVSEEVENVKFGKVNMEDHQEIGQKMGVRALPTTIIVKDGEEVARNAGVLKEDELKNWIEENA